MAIRIKNSNLSIKLSNTGLSLSEVYCRFDWKPSIDGKSILCRMSFYIEKSTWIEESSSFLRNNKSIKIDVPDLHRIELLPEEIPSITLVEDRLISWYESLGYSSEKHID